MNYNQASLKFAGIELEGMVTENGQAWATISGFTTALGNRQNAQDWIGKQNVQGLSVTVGKFKKAATAYTVETIGDYLDYRIKLGDPKALVLYSATFRADLDRSIKEANGLTVTSEQHEAVKTQVRQALLDKLLNGYDARPGHRIGKSDCDAIGLNELETKIAYERAYIKQKQQMLKRPCLTRQEEKQLKDTIFQTKQKIKTMVKDADAVLV